METNLNSFDKADLIRNLQNAFATPEEKAKEDRLTVETVSVDSHLASRITNIKQPDSEELCFQKYPEGFVIRELISVLNSWVDRNALTAASTLLNKFVTAASEENTERVLLLINASKEMHSRLAITPPGSAMRDMAMVFVIDRINKL